MAGGRSLVRRIIRSVKRDGVRRSVERAWGRLTSRPALARYAVFVWDIDKGMPRVQARIPVQFEMLSRETLEEYARVNVYPVPITNLESRLDEGQVCFMARHDGQIVAGGWIEFGKASVTGSYERTLALTPGIAYFHSAFTVPRFRGYGILPATRSFDLAWLAKRHCRKAACLVAVDNKASLRACSKSGGRRAGTLGYLEWLGWRWDFCLAKGVFAIPGKADGTVGVQT